MYIEVGIILVWSTAHVCSSADTMTRSVRSSVFHPHRASLDGHASMTHTQAAHEDEECLPHSGLCYIFSYTFSYMCMLDCGWRQSDRHQRNRCPNHNTAFAWPRSPTRLLVQVRISERRPHNACKVPPFPTNGSSNLLRDTEQYMCIATAHLRCRTWGARSHLRRKRRCVFDQVLHVDCVCGGVVPPCSW